MYIHIVTTLTTYYILYNRVAVGAINVVKSTVSINYPVRLIVETIDILRRYGMSGLAGVLMRKDFVEAVETLKRVSGIDKMFALSLHELTACIYYKLALERGLRGCYPTAEAMSHGDYDFSSYRTYTHVSVPQLTTDGISPPPPTSTTPPSSTNHVMKSTLVPVSGSPLPTHGCCDVSDDEFDTILKFAPMALCFAYCASCGV